MVVLPKRFDLIFKLVNVDDVDGRVVLPVITMAEETVKPETDFTLKSTSESVSSRRLSTRFNASSLSNRNAFNDTPDSPYSSQCCCISSISIFAVK